MLAALALTGAAVTGCSTTGTGGDSGTGGDTGTDGLLKGAELDAWADGAIPENELGGASYLVREVGSLTPGSEIGVDLADLSGAATLSISCLMSEGGTISVTVQAPGDSGTDTVACSPLDSPAAEVAGLVPVSDAATVSISADTPAVFVYAVTPATEGTR